MRLPISRNSRTSKLLRSKSVGKILCVFSQKFLYQVECSSPMADPVLDIGRQFGESPLKSLWNEDWVISESSRSGSLFGDPSGADPLHRLHYPLSGKGGNAPEARAALGRGNVGESLKQFPVIVGISRFLTGESGRPYSRLHIERVNLK